MTVTAAPLSDITMQPRPMQSPHPRVWMAGGSDSSVDLAVALVGRALLRRGDERGKALGRQVRQGLTGEVAHDDAR